MVKSAIDEERIKELFKQALLEVLHERRDLIYDVFAEVIEDVALAKSIKEGESTEPVSREEVFQTLESKS